MLVITNRYGSDFFGQVAYNRWVLYHIRRVEDRPVSALFLGFIWHIAVRALALVSVCWCMQCDVYALVCACAWYGSPA